MFDFDKVIERRGSYSIKYDMALKGRPDDVIPMWVADMDFAAPPCVREAIAAQNEHGVFGYFDTGEEYFTPLRRWLSARFGWEADNAWLVKTPGVVSAIHISLLAFTGPGESVIVQQPVYYPFAGAVRKTGRKLVVSPLVYEDGHYRIDFDDFQAKIVAENVRAFILCNPHNPVGRVWTRQELTRLGDICLRHSVAVISDEIHQDFVYGGHNHIVYAGLGERYSEHSVICTAPTKTFNLPGLPVANIFIPGAGMRARFLEEYAKFGVTQIGVMEIVACHAAYEGGEQWLHQLNEYLALNMKHVGAFLQENLPQVKLVEPQGTYLAWLDFKALGMSAKELEAMMINKAKVWLQNGTIFGEGGEGFLRMNVACPRTVLHFALQRIEGAVNHRR